MVGATNSGPSGGRKNIIILVQRLSDCYSPVHLLLHCCNDLKLLPFPPQPPNMNGSHLSDVAL